MRWLVVVLLGLTACYRPGSEAACTITCSASAPACPDQLTCNTTRGLCALAGEECTPIDASLDGVSDDAAADGPVADGPVTDGSVVDGPPALCNFSSLGAPVQLVTGEYFTPDRVAQRASKLEWARKAVSVTEGNVDTNNGTLYSDVLISAGNVQLTAARLAPGGSLLFLRIDDPNTGAAQFALSQRTGPAVWSVPTDITVQNEGGTAIPVQGVYELGAPSNPFNGVLGRRIPVTTSAGFQEFETIATTTMRRRAITGLTALGLIYLRQVSFTPDGRRAIMIGQPLGGSISVYVSERANLSSSWSTAVLVYEGGYDEAWPYLTTDCHLYVTNNTAGQLIYHLPPL